MGARSRRWRGFTVLELLVTLFVISVLAAIAIPAFFGRPEVTLENASVLLAHDLRTAQNRSAYLAEPCRFVFDDDGDGYRVLNLRGDVILNPATGQPFVRRYSVDAVFSGVIVEGVECGGDRAIAYDEHGRVLEGARVTLEFRGHRRILVVDDAKGAVTIEGSTSGFVDQGF